MCIELDLVCEAAKYIMEGVDSGLQFESLNIITNHNFEG
jgi:hypothetical protein